MAEPAADPESLGRIVDEAVMHAPACTGLAIGVEQGNVRAQRFYGDTGNHGRPKADTEFEIGSITKTLTATLLAFEDQQGTMHFGDPLARYAPPGFRVPDFNGQPILMRISPNIRRACLAWCRPPVADAARTVVAVH